MIVATHRILARKANRTKKIKQSARSEAIWASVRGILKGPKIDAVAYQRKLRREADHYKV